MEYRCGCPAMYDRNTRRSFAAQCRFVPPCVVGMDPRGLRARPQAAPPRLGTSPPDAPRYVALHEHRIGGTAGAGPADERDLATVRRPPRTAIASRRRCEPSDGRRVVGEDANERMIAAIRHERELRPIGRPAWLTVRATRGEDASSWRGAIKRDDPDLPSVLEGHDVALRRDDGIFAVAECARLTA